jgi:hypothetical protein
MQKILSLSVMMVVVSAHLFVPVSTIEAHHNSGHTANCHVFPESPFCQNQGGNGDGEGDTDEGQLQSIVVSATKIICDSEEFLPNWGSNGGPDITATTASEWMSADPVRAEHCKIQDSWDFEWAIDGVESPQDNVGEIGGAWTKFTNSVTITLSNFNMIWLREVWNNSYVSFLGLNQDGDVSAEFYCHTDVLNYDNYDWINNLSAGETYHCVAWNALPTVVEDGPTEEQQCVLDGGLWVNDECVADEDDTTPTPTTNNEPVVNRNRSQFTRPTAQVLGDFTEGQVLGDSCGLYLDEFVRSGRNNNVEQVRRLQTFLNEHMGANIPVTGFYGPLTLQAVNAFQTKYADDILTPWGLTRPTGIVYQTTIRKINMIECPELAIELPTLVEWSKNPNISQLPAVVPANPASAATSALEGTGGPDEDSDNTAAAIMGADELTTGFSGLLKRIFGQ